MNAQLPTLRDLFVARNSNGEEAPFAALSTFLSGLEWQGLHEHVFDVLDISVVDVLLAGWKKHDEVRAQLKATAADPARTALVHLASHTLESTHTPSIQVRSHGVVVATISFSIQVAFDVAAVELTLRRGEVDVIRPGEISVRGTVAAENTVVLERKLSPMRLPGRITLARVESAQAHRDSTVVDNLEHVAGPRAIVVG